MLDTSGVVIRQPEGMAYDPVSNRLFVANEGPLGSGGQIAYVNLDGSGAGVLDVGGAPVKSPEGIALDPAARTIYWANSADDTIAWAGLNGGEGGLVDTHGTPTEGIYRLALAGGTLYWSGSKAGERYLAESSVNATGSGRVLATALPGAVNGLAADPSAGRLYWLDSESGKESLRWTALSGGAGISSLALGAADHQGTGLAVDPVLGKAYWGNYGLAGTRQEAIGFVSFGGATGGISPTTAPVNGAQDPVVIKSPAATGAPLLGRADAHLTCTQGSWAPDFPGSNVFQAPRSLSFGWSLNGTTIPGAGGPLYTATTPGIYGCVVAATNQAGSTSQGASTTVIVTPGRLELRSRERRLKARPGGVVAFRVGVVNRGDLGSSKTKLCVSVPRKKRSVLRPGKCRSLPPLAAAERHESKLTVRVKRTAAAGAYRLKVTLPGTKATKVSLKVLG